MSRPEEETQIMGREEAEGELVRLNGEGPPTSLIGQLRQMREQKADEAHHDLEVPGYRGCLVLRLGPLGSSVISNLRRRAEQSRSPDVDLNANSDILILACREVLGRQEPDAELETLDPDHGPTRIDEHLAELLKLGTTTARASLLALWDKANAPEIALGLAAAEYVEWSGEAVADQDEEFVGKT